MTGNAAKNILTSAGITLGTKLSAKLIKSISFEVIKEINKRAGMRLVTKFGTKGVVNIVKMVPLAGGLIGGAADLAGTRTIGVVAKKIFLAEPEEETNS